MKVKNRLDIKHGRVCVYATKHMYYLLRQCVGNFLDNTKEKSHLSMSIKAFDVAHSSPSVDISGKFANSQVFYVNNHYICSLGYNRAISRIIGINF